MAPPSPIKNEDWSQFFEDTLQSAPVDKSLELSYLDDILKVLAPQEPQDVDIFDIVFSLEDDMKQRKLEEQSKPITPQPCKNIDLVQEPMFVHNKENEPEVQIIREVSIVPKPKRKYTRRKLKVSEQPPGVVGPMRSNGGSFMLRNAPYPMPIQHQIGIVPKQPAAMVHPQQLQQMQYWALPQQQLQMQSYPHQPYQPELEYQKILQELNLEAQKLESQIKVKSQQQIGYRHGGGYPQQYGNYQPTATGFYPVQQYKYPPGSVHPQVPNYPAQMPVPQFQNYGQQSMASYPRLIR